jgi:hypothetical protein
MRPLLNGGTLAGPSALWMITTYKLRLNSFGRDHSDHGDVLDKGHADIWQVATAHLHTVRRSSQKGVVEFRTDWSAVAKYFQLHYEVFVESPPTSKGPAYSRAIRQRLQRLKAVTPEILTVECQSTRVVGTDDVLSYIQDVFLILNVAAPGSLNLRDCVLIGREKRLDTRLELSSEVFESAWIDSVRSEFPGVHALPLESVVTWFEALDLGARQIAENGVAKALYCLLHLGRDWEFEPTALLWISHALEALYGVPNALSFNFLRDRITLFLDPPVNERKRFAKSLREFYDLRNAFVHGGMSTPRPFASELIDPRLNDFFTTQMDARDFGARLVLASVQQMVARNFKQLQFEERLRGDAG